MKKRYRCLAMTMGLVALSQLSADKASSQDVRLQEVETQLQEKNQVLPEISAKRAFFGEASYLLWRLYAEGFDVADVQGEGNTQITQNLDFEWNSGFRVGAGYRSCFDFWEFSTHWTHLHSRASQSVTKNIVSFSDIGSISKSLHVHLNVIDGEIARFFKVTPSLFLKPHAGVRGLLVSTVTKINEILEGEFLAGQNSTRSRAVGMRAGLDTTWEFCTDFSFYANVGGALLSTTIHRSIGTSFTQTVHAVIAPTVDFALGLAWQHSFEGKAVLSVLGGWELNRFLRQIRAESSRNTAGTDAGNIPRDLNYQGLTTSIRLDF